MRAKKTIFLKDHKQTNSLLKACEIASSNAIRHAKALDLTITYIEDDAVYEEHADGTIIFIKSLPKKEIPFVLKKGMVLQLK